MKGVRVKAQLRPVEARAPEKQQASRAARALALAWAIEEAVEAGRYESYAEVAELLGITRARLSQVMRLRWLPVGVQERVLLGEGVETERGLRRL